jgi:hypothetical protein
MKHLKTFEKFEINEFFDFEKHFDIDEDVLSYVFDDLFTKFPFLGLEIVEQDKSNFKIEIYDESPEPKDNLMIYLRNFHFLDLKLLSKISQTSKLKFTMNHPNPKIIWMMN